MLNAISQELQVRYSELEISQLPSVYFGGGTPSILEPDEIQKLLDDVSRFYSIGETTELTLEANPDDLDANFLKGIVKAGINRLSIGTQSFDDRDLQMMNRAHHAEQAESSIKRAQDAGIENISIDLIYGSPTSDFEVWKQNLQKTIELQVPHVSSYALTVEPKTALNTLIQKGKIEAPKDEVAEAHFQILVETLEKNGFIHYELSNFGKENYFSKNNSAYWLGKKYIGIGPSAHSYDGISRGWNVANNALYLKAIQQNQLPNEKEILSTADRYNEYIMTGLRTIWGVALDRIEREFGLDYLDYLIKQSEKFVKDELLAIENNILKPTSKGKFLTDGIASDLFYINSEV